MSSVNTSSIETLYDLQLKNWEFAHNNYRELNNIKLKEFDFNDFKIWLQFNPKRILSSSAKIDPKSISERPCFLCEKNRPKEQQGIPYLNKYTILINPYPVFKRHLTISSINHAPQLIQENFSAILKLAKDLEGYNIIYNGPKSGASAPDHFHFQAVLGGSLPVEKDFKMGKCTYKIKSINNTDIYLWKDYMRNPITLYGSIQDNMEAIFNKIYKTIGSSQNEEEPMMNITAEYYHEKWIVHLFLRKLHRPEQYFFKDNRQIMMSPGSIDVSGIMIIVREEDFHKITRDTITDIYEQVCFDDVQVVDIIEKLSKRLNV